MFQNIFKDIEKYIITTDLFYKENLDSRFDILPKDFRQELVYQNETTKLLLRDIMKSGKVPNRITKYDEEVRKK